MDIVHFDENIDSLTLHEIKRVFNLCFGGVADAAILDKAKGLHRLNGLLAFFDGDLVGFKLGYQKAEGVFFSWIGGVLPDFRRRGIARILMAEQYKYVLSHGYTEIQTEVSSLNPGMLILNLEEGFMVTDCQHLESGECILLLRKKCT